MNTVFYYFAPYLMR